MALTQDQKEELLIEKFEHQENHLIYAPNSIWHGTKAYTSHHKKETLLRIEVGRLNDFIDFLFEHSEHCDHISQRDAWIEFEEYEYEQLAVPPISEEESNQLMNEGKC